jgi:putative ABC transport system permease protein
MFTLLDLAARNVRRNKSRTALTLGAIGFGVLMTLFLGGFAQGFRNLLIDDTIRGKTGAMQVHRRGYFDVRDNQPLDLDMEQGGELERRIRAVPGVTAVTPRLVFSGLLNNGSNSTNVVVTAMDPASFLTVLPQAADELRGANVDSAPGAAVLGADLARALGVLVPVPGSQPRDPTNPNDKGEERLEAGGVMVFQAAAKDGRQNALDATVAGCLDNGNAFESKRVAYVPLAYAQELLGMPGRVTEYAIAVRSREDVEPVAAALQQALGDEYEVQTWQALRPNVADVTRFVKIVLTAICVVFLIIAVIGVVNTMLMSVLERTREIGTMMAVGVRRGQVLALFVLEAAVQALVGGVVGALLGGGIVLRIAANGGVASYAPGTKVIKYVVPSVPMELAAAALVASLAGAVLAAVYPAWRASRLRPVEALRSV